MAVHQIKLQHILNEATNMYVDNWIEVERLVVPPPDERKNGELCMKLDGDSVGMDDCIIFDPSQMVEAEQCDDYTSCTFRDVNGRSVRLVAWEVIKRPVKLPSDAAASVVS